MCICICRAPLDRPLNRRVVHAHVHAYGYGYGYAYAGPLSTGLSTRRVVRVESARAVAPHIYTCMPAYAHVDTYVHMPTHAYATGAWFKSSQGLGEPRGGSSSSSEIARHEPPTPPQSPPRPPPRPPHDLAAISHELAAISHELAAEIVRPPQDLVRGAPEKFPPWPTAAAAEAVGRFFSSA